MVLMMTGRVRVVLKTKEVIEGDLMPYEDVEALQDHVPLFALFGHESFKQGVFIFTGHKIVFLQRDEIKSMTSLRFT
jgi:hypothetical protein